MAPTKVVEKITAHILCSVTPPPLPPENLDVYDIMRKIVMEPEKPQMTKYGAYALHTG